MNISNPQRAFLQRHQLTSSYLAQHQTSFAPIIAAIAECHRDKSNNQESAPLFIGINGCQGSGKSTLADYIAMMLTSEFSLKTVVCSLDDFYLSQQARQQLASTVHPLLKTRGVPGTHNIALLQQTLASLSASNKAPQSGTITLPRFDKSTDNPVDKSLWPDVNFPIDIVLIEGWCWGCPAQAGHQLIQSVNNLEASFDADGQWRNFVNQQLEQYYQPLYHYMDIWLMLQAPSFDCVYRWRLQQEQKLANFINNTARNTETNAEKNADNNADRNVGHALMNADNIAQFVQYFQRLSEHALSVMPAQVHFLLTLNPARKIVKISRPNAL